MLISSSIAGMHLEYTRRIIFSALFVNYEPLVEFYDQRFLKMKMDQFSATQKTWVEVVKSFLLDSQKYGPDRHIANPLSLPSDKRADKWRPLSPDDPFPHPFVPNGGPLDPNDPGIQYVFAIGDSDTSYNVKGTLPSSTKKFIRQLNMVSERMGVFTEEENPDLVGEKKLIYFLVPECKTSQVCCDTQSLKIS
jgi:hypothetical protein